MSITSKDVQEIDQAATPPLEAPTRKPKPLTPQQIRALFPPKRKFTDAEVQERLAAHERSLKVWADAGWTEEKLMELVDRMQEEDRKAKWID